jgi:hypothetical protein
MIRVELNEDVVVGLGHKKKVSSRLQGWGVLWPHVVVDMSSQ